MTQINTLLELRNQIKDKKPDFIRQDYQRRKRLGRKLKWRKPKGIHSKIRHHFKGRRKMPSPGYSSPRKVKNLHSSGLKMINVSSIEDIAKIKTESEGIIISKTVGIKKKLEILKKTKELNVKVFNLNIDEHIKKIEDFINSKKKVVTKTKEKPKETKAERIEQQALSGEEKKEKDKVLIKRI